MKPTVKAILLLTLLAGLSADYGFNVYASANPETAGLQLSMPVEYINYTITDIDGDLWAEIDGYYPISLGGGCGMLPMVYPIPPNSTNIHIVLDGVEVEWGNYSQEVLHKTAIGEWQMVSCLLENLSDSFVLQIHYEHPIERVNGSYVFLYDLNIIDYLSLQNPVSTAFFDVRFECNVSDVAVYTARVDSVPAQWQPITFNKTLDGLAVEMHSQFGEDLPGDLAVVFSDAQEQTRNLAAETSTPGWVAPIVIDAVFVGILLYLKRKPLIAKLSKK